jgi:soluble lytic murein transglycosylase-like protein
MGGFANGAGDNETVTRKLMIAFALASTPLAPLAAATDTAVESLAAVSQPVVSQPSANAIPALLPSAERDSYRSVFAAIRAGRWADASSRLDAMPTGLLTPFARAELFLARGSPKADGTALATLLGQAPELPQAQQIARMAQDRGAQALPELPVTRNLVSMPGASRRISARSNRSDAVAVMIGPKIIQFIKDDKPADAEALLTTQQAGLTPEALTEWQQRVAWSYYLTGDDTNARRLAVSAQGGAGEWTVPANWVAGLAAWRQRDYNAAGTAFDAVAAKARDYEMRAAGLYWAARSDMAAGRPERMQPKLRTAARLPETFYGLIAGSALNITSVANSLSLDGVAVEWQILSRYPNIRVAAALSEIGEGGYADQVLRHQARIGGNGEHGALLGLAARLNLPSTQIWLAQNGPSGTAMPASARYPMPTWAPQGGWRVDPALVYAHALQESQFRIDAVSRAGAIGLMQIMPGTAQQIARRKGEVVDRSMLNRPAVAFEYGQSYLEMLRDAVGTQGLLPKIIAAYNAGPGSVLAWNTKVRDGGDPLLFIESIPFAETRGYVATVLRNYGMYSRERGQEASCLKAMAQGLWPRFPGLPGKTAVSLKTTMSGLISAD